LLAAACSTQLSVQGQLEENGNSGTVGLDIGLGNNEGSTGSNSGQGSDGGGSSQQQNEPIIPTSEGFLILIGLGLMVMVGLFIGLMSQKRAGQ